jgi:hypothetical protein
LIAVLQEQYVRFEISHHSCGIQSLATLYPIKAPGGFDEVIEGKQTILVDMQAGLPVFPALDAMRRQSGNTESGLAWRRMNYAIELPPLSMALAPFI